MKTITINNLAESTTEEVFEYIKHHLLTQMKRCVDDKGYCLYRNEQGLKCAAGCLIPDDMYYPDLEYRKWYSLVIEKFVHKEHRGLIQRMQRIHDDVPVDSWKHHLDLLRKDIEEGLFNESM